MHSTLKNMRNNDFPNHMRSDAVQSECVLLDFGGNAMIVHELSTE